MQCGRAVIRELIASEVWNENSVTEQHWRLDVSTDKFYELGMKMRRSVLGDTWVDRTLKNRNAFNTEFQETITRHVWGEIWSRPAIDHKTRRYMVMSMMIALHQWEEFKLHVRAALTHGFTNEDIKEIILQATVYCGAPAGNHAMQEAAAVIAESGV
jgi:4-carboxymuconolactone decarboxylase